jgi:hypothetical protein
MQPEVRTQMLLKAFGWQGGTIHQLAEETGCDSHDLLYGEPKFDYSGPQANNYRPSQDYLNGFSAAGTCSLEFNLSTNFPRERGNLEYWFGVMGRLNIDVSGKSWID